MIEELFQDKIEVSGNFLRLQSQSNAINQSQTNDAFSHKWEEYEKTSEKEKLYAFQKEWYLKLYGFEREEALASFLQTKKYIFDAGCGLGYKSEWFAKLAPESIVIGMDFSESVLIAAKNYKDVKNLYFIQGDIASTPFRDGVIDYVSCDQVIMHTENPDATFQELSRITKAKEAEFACYVYAKKALPRELLDDYFRIKCKDLSNEELMQMSRQLTQLGKVLSELNITVNIPDIPLLGIKGGDQDLQRFIYWNFIKCFWNDELGYDTSVITNFDWYSPSNAKRYSEEEFKTLVRNNKMKVVSFHAEEACYSGRFAKA